MTTLVVGLTGNVASGKSTVRRLLGERGAATLDADAVVGTLYAPGGAAVAPVAAAFGADLVDAAGAIDKPKLSARVTGSPDSLKQLERIVHPLVQQEVERWIAAERELGVGVARIAVVEATLTFEAGTDGRHDVMVTVDAPIELRRRRAEARGLPPAEFDRREARLMPAAEKRERSRFVVENDGDDVTLRAEVEALWEELMRIARERVVTART